MTALLRCLLLIPFFALASGRMHAATASSPAVAPHIPAAWPSFLVPGEVFCMDELDFNAFSHTGRFHTRGSQESCTRVTQLTRVVVLVQSGQKAEIRVASGAMEATVGWTNARLPFVGDKLR
jgi:hypothetical protein